MVRLNSSYAKSGEAHSVQRTYPRDIFEKLWVNASGGMLYVIYKGDMAVPK